MFKKQILFLFLFLFTIFSFSCSGVRTTSITSSEQDINEIVKYNGPKVRIAVADFECGAGRCRYEIGKGVKDALVDALLKTNRFIVLERGKTFRAVKSEIDLAQSGYVRKDQAPKKGLMDSADILVLGAIVAFEPNADGISGGIGTVLTKIPLVGGIRIKKKEAYIAAIIRLVDVRTGRIISSTRIEGKASNFKISGLGGWYKSKIGLGGTLELYKNTPAEKAIMVLIDNAVKEIIKRVPEEYYRYSSN